MKIHQAWGFFIIIFKMDSGFGQDILAQAGCKQGASTL